MTILRKFYLAYRDVMENKSDPRTSNWFMMDSPFPTIAISLFYIFSVNVSHIYINYVRIS